MHLSLLSPVCYLESDEVTSRIVLKKFVLSYAFEVFFDSSTSLPLRFHLQQLRILVEGDVASLPNALPRRRSVTVGGNLDEVIPYHQYAAEVDTGDIGSTGPSHSPELVADRKILDKGVLRIGWISGVMGWEINHSNLQNPLIVLDKL